MTGLREENEILRERIALLEGLLRDDDRMPIVFGLSPSEARIFGLLMKREFASREQMMTILYSAREDEEPTSRVMDMFIWRLRKKLEPHGIEIKTRYTHGWFMEPDAKGKARGVIAQASGSMQ